VRRGLMLPAAAGLRAKSHGHLPVHGRPQCLHHGAQEGVNPIVLEDFGVLVVELGLYGKGVWGSATSLLKGYEVYPGLGASMLRPARWLWSG